MFLNVFYIDVVTVHEDINSLSIKRNVKGKVENFITSNNVFLEKVTGNTSIEFFSLLIT